MGGVGHHAEGRGHVGARDRTHRETRGGPGPEREDEKHPGDRARDDTPPARPGILDGAGLGRRAARHDTARPAHAGRRPVGAEPTHDPTDRPPGQERPEEEHVEQQVAHIRVDKGTPGRAALLGRHPFHDPLRRYRPSSLPTRPPPTRPPTPRRRPPRPEPPWRPAWCAPPPRATTNGPDDEAEAGSRAPPPQAHTTHRVRRSDYGRRVPPDADVPPRRAATRPASAGCLR